MKVAEVPQDRGMITGAMREICYAVDDNGRYVLAPSAGWEPKNMANHQAWDLIRAEVAAALKQIRAGRRSPLAFHMVNNQMSPGLLARYAGCSRLQVWWHLRPAGFSRLSPQMLQRYAEIFDIDPAALKSVPSMEPGSSETRD
jgi:hypothetical protein